MDFSEFIVSRSIDPCKKELAIRYIPTYTYILQKKQKKVPANIKVCVLMYYYLLYCYMGHTCVPVFLISLYGTPLAQRASNLALHSSLFGPVAQVIMIILLLTALTLC